MKKPAFYLRPATAADIEALSELAARIWNQHYPPIIGQAQVDYMLEKMYSRASLEQQMAENQHFHLLLDNQERPFGYCSVSTTDGKTYFLHKLYIDPAQQGQGYGARVLDYLHRVYTPEVLRLTVNRQNIQAINFYFKMGFQIERAADFDIGGGYFMNDFVMIWTLMR